MSKDFYCNVMPSLMRQRFARLLHVTLAAAALALASPAFADQGCEDMRQLCKDATANADKCAKAGKSEAPPNCKPLIDVREATCTQAEIICKPATNEQQR